MIRLEEKPFELEGQRYTLRCNMAVLETIEDAHGDFEAFLKLPVRKASLELLAAMMNDDLEQRGLVAIWTPEELKRKLSYAALQALDLIPMLFRSIIPASAAAAPAEENTAKPEDSGN